MQRGRSGSSSNSPDTIFVGVRFVLFGFDSVSEAQYRSEIVTRGGTDLGRYDSSCTHVVVCGRVYDDPVCAAARQDGKALVTELWIDDSLDAGMLEDAARILYRPVKDLNGIPGSESLCICLTGYQRQERDDIMKMVSLMGARFSKPLIANQVTHLICYKFEGEKYELAKKVNIKLVNHRWLEDCLKAWEILPTDNYTKSGWELEILDAEARDSEEETEDAGRNALRNQSLMGPSLQGGVPASPTVVKSKAQKDIIPEKQSHSSEDCLRNNSIFSTPYKETTSQNALDTYLNNRVLEGSNHKDAGITNSGDDCIMKDAVGDRNEPDKLDSSLNMEGSGLPSGLRTAKRDSPLSIATDERSINQSYSRKTSRKLVSAEAPSNILPSPKRNSEVSGSTFGEARASHVSADIPSPTPGASAQHSEARSSSLPQKRKVGERSPKSELEDLKASARARCEQMETTTTLPHSSTNGLKDVDNCSDGSAILISRERQLASPSKYKSLSYKKKYVKREQPATGTKIFNTTVSHSDGNKADLLCQSHTLDGLMSIPNKLPALESRTTGDASPTKPVDNQQAVDKHPSTKSRQRTLRLSGIGVRTIAETFPKENSPKSFLGDSEKSEPGTISDPNDATGTDIAMIDIANATTEEPGETFTVQQEEGTLPPDTRDSETKKLSSTSGATACNTNDVKAASAAHTKKVVSKRNLGSKKHNTGNSRKNKDVACLGRTSASSQAAATVGDFAMSDTANTTTEEPRETFTVQQEERLLPPHTRDSETRKHSSTASAAACIENDVKAASGAHTKKVVSKRNLGSKKHSTGNSRKDKALACLDRTAASNQAAAEPGIVGKLKAEQKLESENSDVKNQAVEPISIDVAMEDNVKVAEQSKSANNSKSTAVSFMDTSLDSEKENKPRENGSSTVNSHRVVSKQGKKPMQDSKSITGDNKKETQINSCTRGARSEPACFILSGHRLQRKEFQTVIKRLKGRLCWDSHNWSYQATHLIVPDPVRRTEKLFAAAAAGRWILKTDYLTASNESGRFLDEEPFEWYRNGLTEDGAISLEAPRKWRLLRERTGHGALYGMRLIIYGDCIAPTLDTLKRVVRAGDGTILATSPPYTRFLKSDVDYAIISPGMPCVDAWVQEFLRHEIPCVAADYLVEYVCKPGYSLERHVLYKTHAWAEKSFEKLLSRSEEVVAKATATPLEDDVDDISCAVCGSRDMGEVMLICGDEGGAIGCGIGTHIGCCIPPLEVVPEGDWFCPKCSKGRASKAPLKSRRLKSSTKLK